jgi:hypothetical protein
MSEGKRQCTAIAKATGERCRKAPILGGSVCAKHGGSAGQVRRAARRRLEVEQVEADARAVLAHQGIEAIADPFTELSRLGAELVAMKDAVAARVNSLEAIRYSAAGSGTEQVRGELVVLGQLQDRVTKVLTVLISSGFEARRVQLAERQGALVHQALMAIFERLGLDERQRGLISTVVPEELRKVAAIERATVPGEVVR